ncbi:MAG: HAMP domain-containing sensor histidine kinase [Patescibacteria group bacterium]|jgi:signal transduction histidine kinase
MSIFLFILLIFALGVIYMEFLGRRNDKNLSAKKIRELEAALKTTKSELDKNIKSIKDLHEKGDYEVYAGKIVAKINQGIICIDQNRTVQLGNEYAKQFLEISPVEGKPYQQVINILINGAQDYSLFEAALGGKEQILPDNVEVVTKRGKIPISGAIVPLSFDSTNKIIAFTFADNSKNITRIQEEKTFFSTAAHELRTPLTSIRMSVSLLLQQFDTLPHEKIIEYLTRTNKSIEDLIKLVNNILNVSRIDLGRMTIDSKPFNMVSLTDEVIKELSLLAKERKLFINHEPFEDEYRNVIGDPAKTKEVLTNLINNSIKYTIQGGITITHHTTDTAFITKIADTGSGIPVESQRLLFKKYFQIGGARLQPLTRGSGLGLFISKKIAQLMHGDVILESSEPGTGSTFAFSLPII